MTKNYLKFRSRVIVIVSIMVLAWFGLSMRLFQIQILTDPNTVSKDQAVQAQIPIPAVRGNIYDGTTSPTRIS
ncbi:MAG: hypothetical protein CM1200mP10_30890 [Candidatus Neomarinimicrobiota bacterium]|nr:MAG: hypothetical protein CM1200mP10_30890 [Candidatus Neomarinimicrobiota bacterium]